MINRLLSQKSDLPILQKRLSSMSSSQLSQLSTQQLKNNKNKSNVNTQIISNNKPKTNNNNNQVSYKMKKVKNTSNNILINTSSSQINTNTFIDNSNPDRSILTKNQEQTASLQQAGSSVNQQRQNHKQKRPLNNTNQHQTIKTSPSDTQLSQQLKFPIQSATTAKTANNNTEQLLKQKLQTVSCLYTNYTYPYTNSKFTIDEIQEQKYRAIIEKEREEKNQIIKQLEQKNEILSKLSAQKQTVMFAYRTLQNKIKQHEKVLKKLHLEKRKQKISINCHDGYTNINGPKAKGNHFVSKDDDLNENYIDDELSDILQQELMKTRQLMTELGIVVGDSQKKKTDKNKMSHFQSLSRIDIKGNKIHRKKYNDMGDSYNDNDITDIDQKMSQQEYLITKCEQLQLQLTKMQQIIQQNHRLTEQCLRNQQQLSQNKQLLQKVKQDLQQSKREYQLLKDQNEQMVLQLNSQSQLLEKTALELQKYEQQAQMNNRLIAELQQTNMFYIQKQQREQHEICLLKQFTQNLKLSDQKINLFVKEVFIDKLKEASSSDRLFKQDLSYVLHLVKKKENLYDELIKQYQAKNRETQTRCYLIQKKLILSDNLVKKIQAHLSNTSKQYQSINKSTPQTQILLNSIIQKYTGQLAAFLQNYNLDKRLL